MRFGNRHVLAFKEKLKADSRTVKKKAMDQGPITFISSLEDKAQFQLPFWQESLQVYWSRDYKSSRVWNTGEGMYTQIDGEGRLISIYNACGIHKSRQARKSGFTHRSGQVLCGLFRLAQEQRACQVKQHLRLVRSK